MSEDDDYDPEADMAGNYAEAIGTIRERVKAGEPLRREGYFSPFRASTAYADFLASKAPAVPNRGLRDVPQLSSYLFPLQRHCVDFALRTGGSGCFLSTGLGKTGVQLEYCQHAADATNGRAMILAPLAVAGQIHREGKRFGYRTQVVRDQSGVAEGISICNYDRLDKLDLSAFGAVSCDEGSIVKSYTGQTTRKLIERLARHRFKMSATATPAPNDHMELGQQCELLGVMPSSEMLMRWFISDQTEMGRYRLKGHAQEAFWDWMASWSRMAEMPSDLGGDDAAFVLPKLTVHRHRVEGDRPSLAGLFGVGRASATEMFAVKRQTADARAKLAAELVCSPGSWVVWVDTDFEADAFRKVFPAAQEVRGSHSIDQKEATIAAFLDGSLRVLVTKPSIAGHGLNLQFCHQTIFMGRSFSYELWFQAVRRFWRFGQTKPVHVHLIVAEGEDAIGRVIDRKSADHATMRREMVAAMRRSMGKASEQKVPYRPDHNAVLPRWVRSV